MGDYGDLKSKERDNVKEPDLAELFKGLAWTAAGVIGISFIIGLTKGALYALFGIIGVIGMSRYLQKDPLIERVRYQE